MAAKKRLFVKLFVVFAAMLILDSYIAFAAGLGIAPARLMFENVLKGETAEKQLSVQNPGDEDILVTINIEGEISGWAEIIPEGKIEVPAGGDAKITIRLTPPKGKPDGEYSGKIHAKAEQRSSIEGSGMGLLPGVDSDITATLTGRKIIQGEVEKILTKDEEYGTPVTFTISFTNKGNIESAPSVKIEIIKGGEGIIDTIEKTMEKIKPGESKDYKIEWPTKGKEQGVYYRGTVTVSLDGEVLEKKEGIGFRILEKGSLKGKNGSSSMVVGIMIILIILAAGVAAYYAITRYKE